MQGGNALRWRRRAAGMFSIAAVGSRSCGALESAQHPQLSTAQHHRGAMLPSPPCRSHCPRAAARRPLPEPCRHPVLTFTLLGSKANSLGASGAAAALAASFLGSDFLSGMALG